jgi:hypothetical protein
VHNSCLCFFRCAADITETNICFPDNVLYCLGSLAAVEETGARMLVGVCRVDGWNERLIFWQCSVLACAIHHES